MRLAHSLVLLGIASMASPVFAAAQLQATCSVSGDNATVDIVNTGDNCESWTGSIDITGYAPGGSRWTKTELGSAFVCPGDHVSNVASTWIGIYNSFCTATLE